MPNKIEVSMSKKDILEKAIQKAIDGGWDYLAFEYNDEPGFTKKSHERFDEGKGVFITDWQSEIPYPHLIFNRDFAKALWGDKIANPSDWADEQLPEWQYHLQQMVIADNPIEYLGENIDAK